MGNGVQEIIIIAAMARNRTIGKDNLIPWSIKEDMVHFRELTKGWPCIMGRKTWESLPKKPLPGRLNVVITKTLSEDALDAFADTKVCSSLPAAIGSCADYEKVFICGGETIYRQALEISNRIELTVVHKDYEGDTFFPEIDTNCWKLINNTDFDTFSFLSYVKV